MKNTILVFLLCLLAGTCLSARTVTDVYNFKMNLQVPRIYDNMTSQGSRKYQTQKITGHMCLSYDDTKPDEPPVIWFSDLTNLTHQIGGRGIGYKCTVDDGMHVYPRVVFIGSNKTDKFRTPSIMFYLDAEPDYNVGEDTEDNSLLITLAGRGVSSTYNDKTAGYTYQKINSFRGYAAGTLGCGCKAYGHISPTRAAGLYGPTDIVDDVAAVMGSWNASYNKKLSTR